MALTAPQIVTLRAGVFAVPAAAALLSAGNVAGLLAWCNDRPGTNVFGWRPDVNSSDLNEAIIENAAQADNLTAGRRWVIDRMLAGEVLDATSQKVLDGIAATLTASPTDVQALRRGVLRACRERASNAEVALGGSSIFPAGEATITGIVRAFVGSVDETDVKIVIFKNNGDIWTAQG